MCDEHKLYTVMISPIQNQRFAHPFFFLLPWPCIAFSRCRFRATLALSIFAPLLRSRCRNENIRAPTSGRASDEGGGGNKDEEFVGAKESRILKRKTLPASSQSSLAPMNAIQ